MFRIILLILFCLISLNAKEPLMSIYNFKVSNIDEEKVSMSKYRNKVLLIVNVASKCAFTPQYEGLEKLYEKYKDQNFMILGFPSNEFSNQEPGSNQEIKEFCSLTYKVKFDMFSKIEVNGEDASPLYKYLKEEVPGFLGTQSIKWNFTKFLVNKRGEVVDRFSSTTKPKDIEDDIARLLKQ